MEIAMSIIGALVGIAAVAFLSWMRRVTPDVMLIAVRSGGLPWTPFAGSLRDAQMEGWIWAATKSKDIIRVDTGERTGKRLKDLPHPGTYRKVE